MVGDRNWIPSLVMGLVPGGRGGGKVTLLFSTYVS